MKFKSLLCISQLFYDVHFGESFASLKFTMREDEGSWTSEALFLVLDWGDKVHYDNPMLKVAFISQSGSKNFATGRL